MKTFLKRLALFTSGFYLGGCFVVTIDIYTICGAFEFNMLYYSAIWPYSAVLLFLN